MSVNYQHWSDPGRGPLPPRSRRAAIPHARKPKKKASADALAEESRLTLEYRRAVWKIVRKHRLATGLDALIPCTCEICSEHARLSIAHKGWTAANTWHFEPWEIHWLYLCVKKILPARLGGGLTPGEAYELDKQMVNIRYIRDKLDLKLRGHNRETYPDTACPKCGYIVKDYLLPFHVDSEICIDGQRLIKMVGWQSYQETSNRGRYRRSGPADDKVAGEIDETENHYYRTGELNSKLVTEE